MTTAAKLWNVQRLADLAEKKTTDYVVDDLLALPAMPPEMFATEAHAVISRHRERLAATVAALEASR